jgi:hypothetical protein
MQCLDELCNELDLRKVEVVDDEAVVRVIRIEEEWLELLS